MSIKDITFDELYDLYITQELGCQDIGTRYNVSHETVRRYLKKFDIKIRNASESKKTRNVRKKKKETCASRYGVDHPSQLESVKKKKKETSIKNYGVSHPRKSKIVVDKTKETCLAKYGGTGPASSRQVREKMVKTMKARYGYSSPQQVPAIREKTLKTNIEKYGKEYHYQTHISDRALDLLRNPDWLREQHHNNQKSHLMIAKELSVSPSCVDHWARQHNIETKYHNTSAEESEVEEFLTSLGINFQKNDRTVLGGKEIDFYLPEHQLAIELNGVYWHSELAGKTSNQYHINKTKECLTKGIRLFHVWDTEWNNLTPIVKSRILNAIQHVSVSRVYARGLIVREVSTDEKRKFLNQNHLSGDCPSSINLGLYDKNNQLISLMALGKPRYNRKYKFEILRLCSLLNHSVVGGASKLFTYFLRTYSPESVISYADRRWGEGNVYSNLGFVYSHSSGPSYFYTKNYRTLENRTKYQKKKLSEKLSFFDPLLSEWSNMMSNGYDRIWDCGCNAYIYQS